MIQRIQSVYLLLVTVLLVVAICMPVGQFIGAEKKMKKNRMNRKRKK